MSHNASNSTKLGGVFSIKSLESGIFLLISDTKGQGIFEKDKASQIIALFHHETTMFSKGSKYVVGIKIAS